MDLKLDISVSIGQLTIFTDASDPVRLIQEEFEDPEVEDLHPCHNPTPDEERFFCNLIDLLNNHLLKEYKIKTLIGPLLEGVLGKMEESQITPRVNMDGLITQLLQSLFNHGIQQQRIQRIMSKPGNFLPTSRFVTDNVKLFFELNENEDILKVSREGI